MQFSFLNCSLNFYIWFLYLRFSKVNKRGAGVATRGWKIFEKVIFERGWLFGTLEYKEFSYEL